MNESGVRHGGPPGPSLRPGRGADDRGRPGRLRLALAAGAALAPLLLGGCVQTPEPFDPRVFDHGPRDTIIEPSATRPKPGVPTTMEATTGDKPFVGPVDPGAPIIRLTLREIIQRVAANNKEARVAGYEPSIEETREVEAEARFDPAFFLNGTYEIQRILAPNQFSQTQPDVRPDPFQPREFRTLSGQMGIRQLLPTGAQAEWSYRAQRIQSNTDFTFDPNPGDLNDTPITFHNYYLSELLLRITQPLLRDFGTDVNRARITISRQNRRVSLLEFRRTLEQQLFQTEQAYWQLVQAETEVRIQEELLRRSIDTYTILNNRFIAGVDVSRVQVSQAASFVESQRAVLLRAQSRVGELSDLLKRFMNDDAYDVAGPAVILPADWPLIEHVAFDQVDLIDAALNNRPELGQQIARIRVAEITQGVAANNLLPQLNLTGSISFQGAGLDMGQAVRDMKEWEDISSSLGLELEIPIGNRAARAIYRRVQLQRLQAIEQYRNLMDQTKQEVKTSLREVETSWSEIRQRRQARFTAADSLLAIRQRAEAGEALTPTFVQLTLDAQERLARAQAEEAAAITGYNIAISRLEQAKGTLLRYNNVVIDEEPVPGGR